MKRRIAARLIEWLARWAGIERLKREPAPPDTAAWDDLATFVDFRPMWPRIAIAPLWNAEIEPWLKRLLLETDVRLRHEVHPETKTMLQVRAQLLEGLIQQPQIELARLQMKADNLYAAGTDPREAQQAVREAERVHHG